MILKAGLVILVDWRLDLCACMYPVVVTSECGVYCWNCLAVIPGYSYRKPALMALVQVNITGKKRVA